MSTEEKPPRLARRGAREGADNRDAAAAPEPNPARPESVIWIASFPKSGNSWMQRVIRRAGKRFGFPQTDLDVYKLIAAKRRPEVVDGIRPAVSANPTTVLKTHAKFDPEGEIHPELKLHTAGFVHVMRNPLDMLLSYINFTRMVYERRQDSEQYRNDLFIDLLGFAQPVPYEKWVDMKLEDIPRENLDHALDRFAELGTAIPGVRMVGGTWLDHCFSWVEAGKTVPSAFFKYEELLQGPEQFLPLGKLFRFPERLIRRTVDVVNNKQRGMQYKKIFYNKMSSRYYAEFFSEAAISRFLERYGSELKRLGYGDLLGLD